MVHVIAAYVLVVTVASMWPLADTAAATVQPETVITSLLRGSSQSYNEQLMTTPHDNVEELEIQVISPLAAPSSLQLQVNALGAIYRTMGGPQWVYPWNLSAPLYTWHGVQLEPNSLSIVGLNLSYNRLTGAHATFVDFTVLSHTVSCRHNSIRYRPSYFTFVVRHGSEQGFWKFA
jgi:hypothetical protein